MQQANRQSQILDVLRQHRRATTAAFLASQLGVAVRTIYRDIASMIANGIPILSETGIGYQLEAGYDLPPLMFDAEELEALILGAQMVKRRGDLALGLAADRAISKITYVLPQSLKPQAQNPSLRVVPALASAPSSVDLSRVRSALRQGRKASLLYRDEVGAVTTRIVWPVVLGFFEQNQILVAWCEMRDGFRHFRTDRIEALDVLIEKLPVDRLTLEKRWQDESCALRDASCPETSNTITQT